ncbi:MAG TPA: polysaccharide deacetylase family protein [Terriglobales bacterium]|nr:polysaccharide deacetylase family protein [Terriglobales bacterium]
MLKQKLGYPANARLLIIHADDMGMAHSVDRATIQALENHWITSASIMVPCPWFPEVAAWAKAHPTADLGIHLVLDSEWQDLRWAPLAGRERVPSLLDSDGYFFNDPDLLTHARVSEVDTELRAQIERAKAAGIPLSHFDSHMIALASRPDLFQEYAHLGRDYAMPIRLARDGPYSPPSGTEIAAADYAAGQPLLDAVVTLDPGVPERDWLDWYKKQLTPLKPGIYELVIHLAYDDEEMRGATRDHPDWGAAWRQSDFDMVRSPEFRQFLKDQGFILVGWKDLMK